jgi:hypothetical protein
MTGKVIIVYVGGFFMGIIRTKYAIESKLQAIELHLKGLGKFTSAKEQNIGRSIIIGWVQHYEREGLAWLEEKRGKATSKTTGINFVFLAYEKLPVIVFSPV